MLIAPSVLAADYTKLHEEINKVQTADFIHLDIMDGHFVPNISFGPAVVKSLRPLTEVTFDVHLMISDPLKYLEEFKKAGADIICFHYECDNDPAEVIDKIIELGMKPAMSVKPGTAVDVLFPYCDKLYMALVMTVEPGFGGQSFMPDMLPKVRALKEKFPELLVEVDGGVNAKTIKACADAGADISVAGTAVFGAENPAEAIEMLRNI